jgi:cell division protein FtsI (penicillin-binding protein 3)
MQATVSKNRVNFTFFLLIFTFILFIVRAFYLHHGQEIKIINHEVKKNSRIDILDRNGEILAANLVTYTLYAEPSNIRSVDKLVNDLKKLFPEQNWTNILKKLRNKKIKGRVLIIRDLSPKQRFEVNNLGHVGLYFHEDHKRFYPHKNILSHIIGYVDYDENGLAGFEGYFDRRLARTYEQDAINLSIDIRLQNIAHEELHNAVNKFSANGGIVVIANVNNGEIYALVSNPDFNPYDPSQSLFDKNLNNKASYGLYEMGSTFKIFTMAQAIDSNLIDLDEKIDVSNDVNISGFKIEDFKKIKEEISLKDVFVRSSNIGTIEITKKFTAEEQQNFFNKLELFSPLNIELIEKSYSSMPKNWGITRQMTASYGYGISVSAIHLTQAIAAIVNGGKFQQFTLLKDKYNEHIPKQIINADTSYIMRELMAEVVDKGTARRAKSRAYDIGGKTGSANKIGVNGYDEGRLLSSFVGVFPIEEPEFLVYAFLDEPQAIKETNGYATGGATAAPLVKNIIEKIAPIYNIAPKNLYE